MSKESGLPDGLEDWIAEAGGGRVTRCERHVARREAWVVDVLRPDGTTGEYFLRLDRVAARGGEQPFPLSRETRVLESLAGTKVIVPAIHAWSDTFQAALQERVAGRADLHEVPAEQQRPVFEHFIDLLVELHRLDPKALGLDDFPVPATPEAAALSEVETLEQMLAGRREAARPEPLASFGAQWLRRHVPSRMERVALLQGDTGPANFLFEGDRVTAIVDWEWAHLGDPMEDLGNVCAREFFHPSGDLAALFRRYAERSGAPVDLDRVRYFRVQQMVRSVIGLVHVTEPHDPRGPVAMNLGYRVICQRALCQAIESAIGAAPATATLPGETGAASELFDIVSGHLREEIAPALEGWKRHRAEGAAALVSCLEREQLHGPALEALECDEMAGLLGRRPASYAEGLAALDAEIPALPAEREAEVLAYLGRRALRAEALYEPVVRPFANRRFSPIE